MAFRAVLDACVLIPFTLRDTLLRLAEVELYDAVWSDRILEEVRRNLASVGLSDDQVDGLLECLRVAFEEACADENQIAALESSMGVDEGDRHVLAAAVAAGAEVIVTNNLRHFVGAEAHGVGAIHPDAFLCDLFEVDPHAVIDVLRRQAEENHKPDTDIEGLIEFLAERSGVPNFAERVREALDD